MTETVIETGRNSHFTWSTETDYTCLLTAVQRRNIHAKKNGQNQVPRRFHSESYIVFQVGINVDISRRNAINFKFTPHHTTAHTNAIIISVTLDKKKAESGSSEPRHTVY